MKYGQKYFEALLGLSKRGLERLVKEIGQILKGAYFYTIEIFCKPNIHRVCIIWSTIWQIKE